jgi:hypothetical protein
MKRVPGPRRVVVSFQFVGLGEEDVIWTEGGRGILAFVSVVERAVDRLFLLGLPRFESDDDVRLWTLVAPEKEGSRERRWDCDLDWGWRLLGETGEKKRSSVCHRGMSNSSEPWLARIVSQ